LLIDHTVSVQVQVKVVAGAGAGLVSNTGTVTATSTDPVAGNNSDTASITITASAASQAAAPPAAGQSGVLAQLPRTGTSLGGPLSLAALLCGAGVLTLIIARRRRSATA
jgi:LPXTG-motif cell wall-anchored protein